MKLKITLEVELDDPPIDGELALLLRDALGEFVSARTPIAAYIQKRYGAGDLSQRWMQNKEAEIFKRRVWADRIFYATNNIIIEVK